MTQSVKSCNRHTLDAINNRIKNLNKGINASQLSSNRGLKQIVSANSISASGSKTQKVVIK